MLWDKYDLVILDLDGVLYIGDEAVPYAIDAVNSISGKVNICAATNNASRTASSVASHLSDLGLSISEEQIFTSAEAAAAMLVDLIPFGSDVLAVGGEGVEVALSQVGFNVLRAGRNHVGNAKLASRVKCVVQGHGAENNWWDFNVAMQAILTGASWLATNRDLTVPIPGGAAPGNGAFVKLLSELTGAEPLVAGKPEAPLFVKAASKYSAKSPLVIGDRFDTDIDGAVRAGFDSLLVQTGVHKLEDATTNLPTYVAADLRVLLQANPAAFKVRQNDD